MVSFSLFLACSLILLKLKAHFPKKIVLIEKKSLPISKTSALLLDAACILGTSQWHSIGFIKFILEKY